MSNADFTLMKSMHHYWFGVLQSEELPGEEITNRWFTYSKTVDEEITKRYKSILLKAGHGECAHWRDNGQGCLVLILLFDQFPRHIYRGTGEAFSFGEQAVETAQCVLEQKDDESMHPVERNFCYLPFMHSEDIMHQEKSLILYKRLLGRVSSRQYDYIRYASNMARDHHDIIARFGRFPHRNEVLGRQSSEEEITFLAEERKNHDWMN